MPDAPGPAFFVGAGLFLLVLAVISAGTALRGRGKL